jgi:hypothetical protein
LTEWAMERLIRSISRAVAVAVSRRPRRCKRVFCAGSDRIGSDRIGSDRIRIRIQIGDHGDTCLLLCRFFSTTEQLGARNDENIGRSFPISSFSLSLSLSLCYNAWHLTTFECAFHISSTKAKAYARSSHSFIAHSQLRRSISEILDFEESLLTARCIA